MTAIASELGVPDDTLSRAKQGDHDAFAALVERYEAMVFSLAFNSLGDRNRAEELAQDVFLQLYRSLASITSDDHLRFWLRQVTSRRCIDQIRRTRLRAVSLEDADDLPAAGEPPRDPLLDRRLRELVAGLPDAQRLIVTLRYQEDLDPSEICRILDMPVNTVKSHLHRALQALRSRLGDYS